MCRRASSDIRYLQGCRAAGPASACPCVLFSTLQLEANPGQIRSLLCSKPSCSLHLTQRKCQRWGERSTQNSSTPNYPKWGATKCASGRGTTVQHHTTERRSGVKQEHTHNTHSNTDRSPVHDTELTEPVTVHFHVREGLERSLLSGARNQGQDNLKRRQRDDKGAKLVQLQI